MSINIATLLFIPADDIDFCNTSSDAKEKTFHSIIGHIEDILMDDNFMKIYNDFMERHWSKFDDSEENKLFYIDIFKEYQDTVEKYLEGELVKKIEGFDMCMLEEEIRYVVKTTVFCDSDLKFTIKKSSN